MEYNLQWAGFALATLVVIGTDCIGSCKSNYHTIATMMGPLEGGSSCVNIVHSNMSKLTESNLPLYVQAIRSYEAYNLKTWQFFV